jgi:D-alanyl-D-alanine carboxypeptidase
MKRKGKLKSVSTNPSSFKKKKQKIQSKSIVRSNSTEMLINKQYLLDNPIPFVSAYTWAIMDQSTGELLFGRCETESRQVASLTKIMTAYVVLDMTIRYQLDEHKTLIKVHPLVCELNGTSANLLPNDHLSIWELLHGMMLPSGNDAA